MTNIINPITLDDVTTGYTNIKRIIDMLLKDVSYQISSEAPSNYKAMRESFDKLGTFVVFNGGDHGWLGEEYNVKFRALHDAMHYKYDLSFKFADEKKLSDITKELFMDIAWSRLNLTIWETQIVGEILNAEIKGQIEYYEENAQYVEDQSKFVTDYLNVEAV